MKELFYFENLQLTNKIILGFSCNYVVLTCIHCSPYDDNHHIRKAYCDQWDDESLREFSLIFYSWMNTDTDHS